MSKPKLFIGLEETNIAEFVSPCCCVGLSIEPPSRIACGGCGKTVLPEDAIHISWEKENDPMTKRQAEPQYCVRAKLNPYGKITICGNWEETTSELEALLRDCKASKAEIEKIEKERPTDG